MTYEIQPVSKVCRPYFHSQGHNSGNRQDREREYGDFDPEDYQKPLAQDYAKRNEMYDRRGRIQPQPPIGRENYIG